MSKTRAARRRRAQYLAKLDGVTVGKFTSMTPYSAEQYRYWFGNGRKQGAPNTDQIYTICTTFDWSLNWIFFGVGPIRLSDATVQDPIEALRDEIQRNNDTIERILTKLLPRLS